MNFLQSLIGKFVPQVEEIEVGKAATLHLQWSERDGFTTSVRVELWTRADPSRSEILGAAECLARYDLNDPEAIELDPVQDVILQILVNDKQLPNHLYYWGASRVGKHFRSTVYVRVQEDGGWVIEGFEPMTSPVAALEQVVNRS